MARLQASIPTRSQENTRFFLMKIFPFVYISHGTNKHMTDIKLLLLRSTIVPHCQVRPLDLTADETSILSGNWSQESNASTERVQERDGSHIGDIAYIRLSASLYWRYSRRSRH